MQSLGLPNFHYSRESPYPPAYSTIILPKYIPWAHSVKSAFQWLGDTGIVTHTIFSPVPLAGRTKPKIYAAEQDEVPLAANIFTALFIFGITGLLLATAVLFAEVFVGFKKKQAMPKDKIKDQLPEKGRLRRKRSVR